METAHARMPLQEANSATKVSRIKHDLMILSTQKPQGKERVFVHFFPKIELLLCSADTNDSPLAIDREPVPPGGQ
jgi:hypothetical protein